MPLFYGREKQTESAVFSSARKANSTLLAFCLLHCDETLDSVIGPIVLGGSNTHLQKMIKSLTTRLGIMYLFVVKSSVSVYFVSPVYPFSSPTTHQVSMKSPFGHLARQPSCPQAPRKSSAGKMKLEFWTSQIKCAVPQPFCFLHKLKSIGKMCESEEEL